VSGSLETLDSLLKAVNRELHRIVNSVMDEYEMPMPGMAVLSHVLKEPGLSVSQISRKTNMAKSHVSMTVKSLTRSGFLKKQSDCHDQRLVRVYPTERARTAHDEISNAIRSEVSRALAELSQDEIGRLTEALKSLNAVLSRSRARERDQTTV